MRIYLIPIRSTLVEQLCRLIGAESDTDARATFETIRQSASRHLRVLETGKQFGTALTKATEEREGELAIAVITSLRPYFIAEQSRSPAITAIDRLLALDSSAELFAEFSKQAALVPDLPLDSWPSLQADALLDDHSQEWSALYSDVTTLRGMKKAHDSGSSFIVKVHKQEPFGDGIVAMSPDKTEDIEVDGNDLAEHYGALLGPTLGRIAGLSEPTWWLGRNFWLGLLLTLAPTWFDRLTKRPRATVRQRLLNLAASPAQLLTPIAVEGFTKAFSPVCPGFGTGLYFPSASIEPMQEFLAGQRSSLIALGVASTGYDRVDISQLLDLVEEAFAWAASSECGLLEGDELVGAYGYR